MVIVCFLKRSRVLNRWPALCFSQLINAIVSGEIFLCGMQWRAVKSVQMKVKFVSNRYLNRFQKYAISKRIVHRLINGEWPRRDLYFLLQMRTTTSSSSSSKKTSSQPLSLTYRTRASGRTGQ